MQTHSLDLESGSSQYASIADASQTGLDLTGDFTIEFWFKFESTATDPVFISKWEGTGNQRGFFIQHLSGTNFRMGGSSNGTTETIGSNVAFTPVTGVWYHIAAAYTASAGSCAFYVNGRSLGSSTGLPTSLFNNTAPFVVGAYQTNSNFTDGLIKDVRVFNDVRTQTEIVADARTQNVSDANLKGEWNFNNAYTDSSGNGNTLTATGSPVFSTDRPWVASTQVSGSTYLETSLTSYYTLDESSGNASDSKGTNTLTNNNTVTYAAAKINNGAVLNNGGSKYFSRTSAVLGTSNVALSFWINLPDTTEEGGFIRFGSINGTDGWGVGVGSAQYDSADPGGNNLIILVDGVAWRVFGALGSVGWKHIVITRDGTRWTAFVNGIQLASTFTDTPNAPAALTYVGNDQGSWPGTIDEIAMYSRHLHYGDVLDLYNEGTGITYSAAVATSVKDMIGGGYIPFAR